MAIPRPASIQYSFSLLDRAFETELAEASALLKYDIPLTPFSVLRGGVLGGKYAKKVCQFQLERRGPCDRKGSLQGTLYLLYPGF